LCLCFEIFLAFKIAKLQKITKTGSKEAMLFFDKLLANFCLKNTLFVKDIYYFDKLIL